MYICNTIMMNIINSSPQTPCSDTFETVFRSSVFRAPDEASQLKLFFDA